jgi:Plavaka transposase
MTCTYNGHCSKCIVAPGQLGEYQSFLLHVQSEVLDTYILSDGDVHLFYQACHEAGMKPVYHPFWESLPLTDIFHSITPDILHQMLQGMVKHVIRWLFHIFGAAAINMRCWALPPNHKVLLFPKGMSILSQASGHEHKKMCSILLGLIVNLPVPGGLNLSCIIKAVHALLDFLFVAQYES